jgi:hypothetical protein
MRRLLAFLTLGVVISLPIQPARAGRADKSPARPPRVLIFVYDAGETMGLLPVAPVLATEKVEVRWAPLTPWSRQVLEREHAPYLPPPDNLDDEPHVKDRQSQGDITYWLKLVAEMKPDLVILGLVSRVQEQLAQELKSRSILTVGFYDAFDATTRDSIVWQVASRVDVVWVPTENIKHNLNALGLKSVKVMGQPSLETWYRLAATVKPAGIYSRLQIPPGKKILLFAGQYGEGYAELLDAFLQASIGELNRREDLYLVLSHHPKTAGELERAAAQKYHHPRILLMPSGLSTAEVAAVSDVVITWRSTVGIQATFMGKPVIYFNFKPGDYHNDLTEKAVALTSTPETFGSALRRALSQRTSPAANRQRLAELGYIVAADRKIASEIIRLIRKR